MRVEKFPLIASHGKFLQWDLRQEIENPQIVIRKHSSAEVTEQLKKKGPALVEGKDFSSWGEFVGNLLSNPSHSMLVLGVVGTNGKTTSAALLRHVLSSFGHKVLEVGTLGASVFSKNPHKPDWHEATGFTSPEVHTLQDLLAQAKKEAVDSLVIEVTSHAIALERVAGIEFDGACFLNFSQDHLDFHKTLEEYQRVKESFFLDFLPKQKKKKAFATFNANDLVGRKLFEVTKIQKSIFKQKMDYDCSATEQGIEIKLRTSEKRFQIPLLGSFQEDNVVPAALLLSHVLKRPLEDVLHAMATFLPPPGRMERVEVEVNSRKKIFIVDFAHTPDALEKSLKTLRQICKAKLWVIFGCGGDRDPLKRPIMGRIAADLADEIIVTSDNPRSEDAAMIIEQIVAPIQKTYRSFVSREEAIAYALEEVGENDICLVAGRGHEEFQLVGDQKIPFRDADVIRNLSAT